MEVDEAPQVTSLERKALGVLAFAVGTAPVAILVGVAVLDFSGLVLPDWLNTLTLVAFAILAALQGPLFLICNAVARRSPGFDWSQPRFRRFHPWWLFEFWWKYVR